MSPSATDPPPLRECPDCRAPVAVIIGPSGETDVIDAPPTFDPNIGWICRPHVCPESIERVRRTIADRRPAGDLVRVADDGDGVNEVVDVAELPAVGDGPAPDRPRRFRWPVPAGERHPNGSDARYRYGCYFPRTDLCVNDMGHRSTGEPAGVEWL